jgi:hypothetical protein
MHDESLRVRRAVQTPRPRPQDTDQKLISGLRKLLDGKPSLSDGRLTKLNVAKEAGLSLSTANRSHALKLAWSEQVDSSARKNPSIAAMEAKVATSHQKQRALQSKCRTLENQLKTAHMVIAQMYLLNVELSGTDSNVSMKSPGRRHPLT